MFIVSNHVPANILHSLFGVDSITDQEMAGNLMLQPEGDEFCQRVNLLVGEFQNQLGCYLQVGKVSGIKHSRELFCEEHRKQVLLWKWWQKIWSGKSLPFPIICDTYTRILLWIFNISFYICYNKLVIQRMNPNQIGIILLFYALSILLAFLVRYSSLHDLSVRDAYLSIAGNELLFLLDIVSFGSVSSLIGGVSIPFFTPL